MSDTLADLQKFWDLHLHLILPVAIAVVLVIVVYFCSIESVPAPPLLIVDQVVTTKKERANAKKRAKKVFMLKKLKVNCSHSMHFSI